MGPARLGAPPEPVAAALSRVVGWDSHRPGPGATNPSPPNPPGITFKDTDGDLVNAHGGGIIRVCDTFYLHGEYFLSTTTDNDFNGFSMYSSKTGDMEEGRQQGDHPAPAAERPARADRKGERPHIIKCPGDWRVRSLRPCGRYHLSERQGSRVRDLAYRQRRVQLQRVAH